MLSWHSYRGHRRASEKGWPARSAPSSVQPTVSRCVCACLEDVSVRVRVLGRDVRSGDGPLVPFSLVSCLSKSITHAYAWSSVRFVSRITVVCTHRRRV
jgi:hypothetical protein